MRERDVHSTPTPRLGGVAIFLGFAAASLVARELPYLKGVYSGGQISGVLMGAAIVCLVGAIDDIRELDWLTKLAGQILAAGVMAYKGVAAARRPALRDEHRPSVAGPRGASPSSSSSRPPTR